MSRRGIIWLYYRSGRQARNSGLELTIIRFLLGVAIGADYPIATALLAEFSPKKHRGRMLGILMSMWYLGALVSYTVAFLLMNLGDSAWRWILASSAVPTLILLVMRWGTPESPRWLLSKNRVEEAEDIIKDVYGEEVDLSHETGKVEKTRFKKCLRAFI
ncbi:MULTISPECIES: MFS transporter [Bacillus]|uniref:MFS transporter n=1 Tax=Bacillus TaxID=1386 RepID=UPI0022A9131E|nr:MULTISPECIES: MFS transporter [Bacillus]MDU0071226.1 MFS transporter [Bacillus sp. IG6]MED8019094.1 MFS transporter [Bacillus glycinifermentans]